MGHHLVAWRTRLVLQQVEGVALLRQVQSANVGSDIGNLNVTQL